ncbi:M20/M25/M40 family metallo-hydrolase [Sphingopyxis sp. YF1]|uniref:M20/M25/M40 family metallo-hydrolase n=1 Tax=Sphingopyxis sp. YF1 TaxID=2482763 RepID=UPI001F60B5E3|nr:M20/M25/M40 family metallo-hydrolase [Sphingopyxis sp. YF1]
MQTRNRGAETPRPTRDGFRWLLALLAVLAAVALACLANRLPAPAPETAPGTAFSAARAMHDVRVIAAKPHPIGSQAIEETRAYLVERMTALGLEPRVRSQTVTLTRRNSADFAIGGRVRNIVGELKGSDPTLPAIVVMAHYDTAPLSPGAGDDTAGLAVALETARALRAAGPLRRSVLFLFTDGEEAGLLGATAFFESDPWRGRTGLVVNLEARGDSGRALMFQTSAGNRALIEAYARTAPSPAADSLMVTIYKRMPNDTDLTSALDRGHAGMNFAFVGHQMAYHTPLSTAAGLNPASVQHMGDQVLPLVRDLAGAERLGDAGGDMVFADLFGQYLLVYPSWAGWLLAIAAVGATFAMLAVALARRRVAWRDALAGAGGLLAMLFGIAALLMLALRLAALLMRGIASPYALVGQAGWLLPAMLLAGFGGGALLLDRAARGGRRWPVALALAAVGLLGALLGEFSPAPLVAGGAAALFAFAGFGRRAALAGWFAGAVALVALLALLLQILLPSGAHALVWPLLLLVPATALLLFAPARAARPAGLAAMALSAALLAGLMARSGYDFFVMVGTIFPAAIAPFVLLAILALAPLLWAARRLRPAGLVAIAAGLAVSGAAGLAGRTPSAASPELVEVFHVSNVVTGTAQWTTPLPDSRGWARAALARDGDTPRLRSIAPLSRDDHWIADARPAAFAPPSLTVGATAQGGAHRIDIAARNANRGRSMRIFLKPSVELTGIRLMDRPVPGTLKAGIWSQMIFHASGEEAVRLSLTAVRPGQVEVRLAEVRDGWPEGSRPVPLPPHVIPYRRGNDSVIVTGRIAAW